MRFIALLFLLPRFTFATECDVRSFLTSFVYEEQQAKYLGVRAWNPSDPFFFEARSAWGKSPEAKILQGTFHEFRYLHGRHPLMSVYQGAIAEKNPNLIRILDDINRVQMKDEKFFDEFKRVFKFEPKLKEYKDFYESRVALYRSGVTEYANELGRINPLLAFDVKNKMLSQTQRLLLEVDQSRALSEIKTASAKINIEMLGHLTELYGAVALPQVKKVSVTLGKIEEISKRVDRKVKDILLDLSEDPKVIEKLSEAYPKIFRNPHLEYRGFTRNRERMEWIRDWIHSKEIDVIREADGKTRWVEIKRNQEAFTLETFAPEPQKIDWSKRERGEFIKVHKTPFEQILEDKEIIEFLGLSDKIQLEYLATGGMKPEVKQLLERNGIRVIQAH